MSEGQEAPPQERGHTLKDRHPDWPDIKLKFYFSAHRTAEDMSGMENHMPGADIFFYENTQGNEDTGLYQKVANVDPAQLPPGAIDQLIETGGDQFKGTFREPILRSLFGSKKTVGHIDLRPGDAVVGTDIKAASESKSYIVPNFHETLTNLKGKLEHVADLQNKREKIMTVRLEEELKDIMNAHPEIKNIKGRPVKILATMGAYHSPLGSKFEAEGVNTESEFSHTPYVLDYEDQVQQEIASGKEPNQDMLAKAYVSGLLHEKVRDAMGDWATNSDQQVMYVRNAASQLSIGEIEKIHEMSKNGFTVEALDSFLKEKGMDPLPHSDEELKTSVDRRKE
jgi:hypothetical protein